MSVTVELGTDDVGARFEWEQLDPYIRREGQLTIHVWSAPDSEAAGITLSADDALSLAQFLDDALDR